ncbi:hypothetical protein [Hydrogenophaga defluvii]|uniref:Methyltransferase family protein n=1 Tax=Hydrogenophaga defluvii TaxID=249410 RepID=A0ABW2S9J0_9BURK
MDLLYDVGLSRKLHANEVICEFGAYFGRSTCSLAQGLIDGEIEYLDRRTPPLHTYDIFSCRESSYFSQYVLADAASIQSSHLLERTFNRVSWLKLFERCTADLPDGLLAYHVCELKNAEPPDAIIAGVLFDAPKWFQEYIQILEKFGPKMRIGCLIVFQDYFYHWSATVIAAIQIMMDRGLIEPQETAASSLLVKVVRKISIQEIQEIKEDFQSCDVVEKISASIAYFDSFEINQRDRFFSRLELAAIQYLMERGMADVAKERLATLKRKAGNSLSPSVVKDFQDLQSHNFSLRSVYEADVDASIDGEIG